MPVLARDELERSHLSDLHAIASELAIEGYRKLQRDELIDAIVAGSGGDEGEEQPRRRRRPASRRRREPQAEPERESREEPEAETAAERAETPAEREEPTEVRVGVLDVVPNGSGFVRPHPFEHSSDDVYVSPAQIRRCELRAGDIVEGPVRRPRRSERHPSLVRVDKVNDAAADPPPERPRFEELTAVFARERIDLPDGFAQAPFGRGSRVAVGGPPGAGTTTLLRAIARALVDSGVELMVVLAGSAPEEVTEWRRDGALSVAGGSFDGSLDEQAHVAELAVERAKRAVEAGRHAALVIDSLDALSAGVARRVFGAGRATEEGGSLTIAAATDLAEPMRMATTRIVLEVPGGPDGAPRIAPTSGTTHAEQLK